MTPSEIRFTATPARGCSRCIFADCRSTVCHEATEIAKSQGLPDCDAVPGFIYVIDKSDARQMDLITTTTGE